MARRQGKNHPSPQLQVLDPTLLVLDPRQCEAPSCAFLQLLFARHLIWTMDLMHEPRALRNTKARRRAEKDAKLSASNSRTDAARARFRRSPWLRAQAAAAGGDTAAAVRRAGAQRAWHAPPPGAIKVSPPAAPAKQCIQLPGEACSSLLQRLRARHGP